MQSRNIVRSALATGILLLVPLVAMQFTDEVTWTLSDFVAAAALLFGTGLTYELVARKGGHVAYRAALGLALAAALLLVWMNLAVGIIGSEDNPANLVYLGVLAVGIIGAFLARSRPKGMARALVATALAQISVAVIALIADWGDALILNGFFTVLWVGSALLFRLAGASENQVRAGI